MPIMEIRAVKARDRLREDLGDIAGLAESIKQHGLLHPIVVDDRDRLVAGQRRLEACKSIGLRKIEVKRLADLSAAERREIELEENLHRKDLTAHERSKATAELAKAAEDVAAAQATAGGAPGILAKTAKKDPRGRKPKGAAPKQAAAERTGIPRKTIADAEQHVEIAERYRFMQAPDWTQARALRVGKALDELPAPDRKRIVSLLEGEGVPAKETETMVSGFARAEPQVREKVYGMARSKDPRDRSMAITYLAETAPEPDPRSVWLMGVAREARKQAKRFDGDALNESIVKFAEQADALAARINMAHERKTRSIA